MTPSNKFTNRLIQESSPYLLQHAHNPVDWYAWGQEAFDKSHKENKPILLSIGYATCHWCHVMEKESFEDLEIAAFINSNFVPIKVDREQRPDVDAVYMSSVQMMSGHGGWPMTVFLTSDKKPFFGGTYFPARDGDRGAHMGFLTLLRRIHELFTKDPERAHAQAKEIAQAMAAQMSSQTGDLPSTEALQTGFRWFQEHYDPVDAGFGGAPKFPRPSVFEFLFRYGRRSGQEEATAMSLQTLRRMIRGGMYDQVGGGFHRYSTDRKWLVPHFEKMLYDNAQLVNSLLDAFQITQDEEFATAAKETLDYIAREMTHSNGGFYCATDADSEGVEGKFFVWSKTEVLSVLNEDGPLVAEYFGCSDEGNFEGENILHVPVGLNEFAAKIRKDPLEIRQIIGDAKSTLRAVRNLRIRPITDDKILTAWNGLMIAAFARGGFVLNHPPYIEQAKRAAQFILSELKQGDQLLRCHREGKSEIKGYLDDYAFLTFGLLELFEASAESRWLKESISLQETLLKDFWDEDAGGFFMTSVEHEPLLIREKSFYDGAEPSGNSISIFNLLRLETFTGKSRYREYATKALCAFSEVLRSSPMMVPMFLSALDYYTDHPKEVLIVEPHAGDSAGLSRELARVYLPNRTRFVVQEGHLHELAESVSWVEKKGVQKGQATAYVCEGRVCDTPTTEAAIFRKQLSKITPLEK